MQCIYISICVHRYLSYFDGMAVVYSVFDNFVVFSFYIFNCVQMSGVYNFLSACLDNLLLTYLDGWSIHCVSHTFSVEQVTKCLCISVGR